MKRYHLKILITIFMVVFLMIFVYDRSFDTKNKKISSKINGYFNEEEKFIINTTNCRIENLNPFHNEILKFVYPMEGISCTNRQLLSFVSVENDLVTLHINRTLFKEYSYFDIYCCYSIITRNGMAENPDDDINISECTPIHSAALIFNDTIKVECGTVFQNVYSNVHSIIRPPKGNKTNNNPSSVLIIGFDGMSKLNLMRTMPKTHAFCEEKNWIALKGYNKIDDNTFPNLMAVLTGRNYSDTYNTCQPSKLGKLDTCNFIWKSYQRYNYTTALAEDSTSMGTFNYLKKGFLHPPTDFYFRPYFQATEKLPTRTHCNDNYYCTGPKKTSTRMLDLVKDFAQTHEDHRSFGMFWTNTFSHNSLNCPSTMDEEVVIFFQNLEDMGVLNNTIVIFMSDHGFRYGKIRLTHTGYLEERLPFVYLWLPEVFRAKHSREFANLVANAFKLTSNYDLYMTLQDILQLSHQEFLPEPSRACPKCKSLFQEIDEERSCEDAGIPRHFCSCSKYFPTNREDSLVQLVARFVVEELNGLVASYKDVSNSCAFYFLNQIVNAESAKSKNGSEVNVLVVFRTFPGATFEATVNVLLSGEKPQFKLLESISRLDWYAPRSYCVKNSPVQKYCYCNTLFLRVSNVFCNNYYCFL